MKPLAFGWTRRFYRRARVYYNDLRRDRRLQRHGKLMQWSEWLRSVPANAAGAHVHRRPRTHRTDQTTTNRESN